VVGPISVLGSGDVLQIDDGVVIARSAAQGDIILWSNAGQATHNYLETANRYCTRWIRLDVR